MESPARAHQEQIAQWQDALYRELHAGPKKA
jgi:hypothetical protein